MKAVSVRDLKDRLGESVRLVRYGEEILGTDRGEVVAELRQPIRLGMANRPDVYRRLTSAMPPGSAAKLLNEERGRR